MENNEDLDNINRIASLFKEYWELYDQYQENQDKKLTSRIDDVVDEIGRRVYKLKFAFEDLDYFSKLDEESYRAEIDKKDETKELLRLARNEVDKLSELEIGSNKFRYHDKKYDIIDNRLKNILLRKIE